MFAANTNRRRAAGTSAVPRAESLESRALLSATATLQNGVLTIAGTEGADKIAVSEGGGSLIVRSSGATIGIFNPAAVTGVSANLRGGNDQFYLQTGRTQYSSVNVNMGTGTSEGLQVVASRIQSLKVDARDSFSTTVALFNAAIPNCEVNFGNDQGRDKLLVNTCDVDRLFARMGAGNDTIELNGTSYARNCDVDLGAGDDSFVVKRTAAAKGRVSAGTGADQLVAPAGIRSDLTLRDFERLVWL